MVPGPEFWSGLHGRSVHTAHGSACQPPICRQLQWEPAQKNRIGNPRVDVLILLPVEICRGLTLQPLWLSPCAYGACKILPAQWDGRAVGENHLILMVHQEILLLR